MNMDFLKKIEEEKRRLNATIVSHYYQEDEIQDLADFVGDSLAMAQYSEKTNADSPRMAVSTSINAERWSTTRTMPNGAGQFPT